MSSVSRHACSMLMIPPSAVGDSKKRSDYFGDSKKRSDYFGDSKKRSDWSAFKLRNPFPNVQDLEQFAGTRQKRRPSSL
ncbi:hypothetical protein ACFX13_039985 [Malus domestica]